MLEKQKQRNKVEKVIFQFDETTKKESLIKQKKMSNCHELTKQIDIFDPLNMKICEYEIVIETMSTR